MIGSRPPSSLPSYVRLAPALLALCWLPIAASATETAENRPVTHASAIEAAPTLDGDVLRDPVWQDVAPASGFWQTTPDEGRPATEKTEVRIAYTADTLYVGVVCYDDEPDKIIVSDSRRDASLNETDSFQVVLDTFLDRQNGFVFGTNPSGLEYDGQVVKEGSGGFGSGGGGFNLNWDAAWEVKAKISEIGWSAEMAIPFRTLRYGKGDVQAWGLNFQRNIRRRNETSYWAALPRQWNLHRLSLAGTLEDVDVPSQKNLKIIPYVLVEGRDNGVDSDAEDEVGFDVKYSITPSLTLDATFNTDFAQVEVDEFQINLDRFNLFFPEKRPFFLENAGQFAIGVPQEVELFFSRRIGLGPGGEEVPIDAGLRLSGKVGRYNVGFLQMRSEATDGVVPENDFTVARVNREFKNRSSLGVIAVNREGDGSLGDGDDFNRTYGIDGRWGIGKFGQLQGFVAQTDSPDATGDEYAFRIGGGYDSENWTFQANYSEVAEDFNPEVGFRARSNDYRKVDFFVLRRLRPENFWGTHELRPHISYRGFWNFDGFQETGFLHLDNHFEWPSGFEVHTGVNFTLEGVRQPFEIAEDVVVEADTYEHQEAQLVLVTNEGAPLSFRLRATVGGFFGGDRVALSPTLNYRIGEDFTTELSWNHNDIDLPGGDFKTNLARLRVSYSFTPRLFVQGLFQYNDRADVVSSNLRFGWLKEANTGLFVVYNELREFGSFAFEEPNRSLIVKYSRLVDLFR